MKMLDKLQECHRVGFVEVMRELLGLASLALFLFAMVFGLIWLESL